MALIKCKECGAAVSNKAEVCVKCGAPIKGSKAAQGSGCGVVVLGFIIFAVVIGVISANSGGTHSDAKAPDAPAEETCKKDDLTCLGNKGVVGAGIYCQSPIEHVATHSVKWTDGTFEMKFSRFRWSDKTSGVITYIGDKVEFQNGFGAFTAMIYECDLASDDKTVLDVRVQEGRLP